ncbi:MAG: helix-turn-helix domain-containing protein [Lachnospiraceae bacterium]|nr:helix-turn-helix domain-containing protein [Lachnospiraceae bacterium]
MERQTTYKNVAGFKCLRNIKRQTNDLYLVHCGMQKCPPGYTYNHKIPNENHLHFVTDGKGELVVNKVTYKIRKNDIFLIPKGAEFQYHADLAEPWTYMWVTFDGAMADEYLQNACLCADTPVIHSTIPTDSYTPLIQSILDANHLTKANEIKRVAYLYEILSMLIEAQAACRNADGSYDYTAEAYVDYALQYIKTNYRTIKVGDIAAYVGINRSYLTSLFKKVLNVSPQQYLIKFKLSEAAKYLKTTDMSVSEIAEQVGYGDSCNFTRVFKQIYGVSPQTYRNTIL